MKNLKLLTSITFLFIGVFCFQANAQTTAKHNLTYSYTGELTEQDLLNSKYTERWYKQRLQRYTPNAKDLKTIKKHINDYDIVLFMGTWCPDSHREVPHFYKLLHQADYDFDHLTAYTLNHNMQSKNHDEKGYNITNVPTFIFYKDGKEVNRFVERAHHTLAKDIAQIVSGQDYKHFYAK